LYSGDYLSLSDIVESDINSKITKYGASVTIQKQTATYDSYDQRTPNWTNSTTVNSQAIILPFRGRGGSGEEWHYEAHGTIREDDYIGIFKATEIIEESATTSSATRYIVTFNNQNYEIVQIKPIEFQDNVIMKKCILRLITD